MRRGRRVCQKFTEPLRIQFPVSHSRHIRGRGKDLRVRFSACRERSVRIRRRMPRTSHGNWPAKAVACQRSTSFPDRAYPLSRATPASAGRSAASRLAMPAPSLWPSRAGVAPGDPDLADRTVLRAGFLAYLVSLATAFDTYLDRDTADASADLVTFRQAAVSDYSAAEPHAAARCPTPAARHRWTPGRLNLSTARLRPQRGSAQTDAPCQSTTTTGLSPTTHASCPGGSEITSPGPASISVPSCIFTWMRPAMWYC